MKFFKKIIITLLILLSVTSSFAFSNQKPLPADTAFRLSATAKDNQTIVAMWKLAPGYYLYRNRIHFKILKPKNIQLGFILKPPGFDKTYPGQGTFNVYQKSLQIAVPIITNQPQQIILQVDYQGCAESGFCYPPTTKILAVDLNTDIGQPVYPINVDVAPIEVHPSMAVTDKTWAEKLETKLLTAIQSGNIALFLALFFLWGAAVSLTPCVYPMIPILSSIIIGQKKITHGRSFALSVAYVLGLSITIAIIGFLIAMLGYNLQAALQKPWVIILFSLIIVAISLSLFGLYELQLPSHFQQKLAHAGDKPKHGTLTGAFLMGIFSMLIVSPCATPPFIFALLIITKSGHIELGSLGLFFMGIGMGLPLLMIGASSSKLLPKAGHWMVNVRIVMGVLMLITAIYMLASVIPAAIIIFLWAALALGIAVALGTFKTASNYSDRIKKTLGLVIFIYGLLLVIGGFMGNTNPFKPLNFTATKTNTLKFIAVKNVSDIQQQLSLAQHQNKPALLDFYAKWCKSCLVMDEFTFSQPGVKETLKNFVLLRADVTANTAEERTLEKYYDVIAPPTMIFFNRQHRRVDAATIIGEVNAQQLMAHLRRYFGELQR